MTEIEKRLRAEVAAGRLTNEACEAILAFALRKCKITPEQRRKYNERRRAKYQALTPEQKKEFNKREYANLTPAQRAKNRERAKARRRTLSTSCNTPATQRQTRKQSGD